MYWVQSTPNYKIPWPSQRRVLSFHLITLLLKLRWLRDDGVRRFSLPSKLANLTTYPKKDLRHLLLVALFISALLGTSFAAPLRKPYEPGPDPAPPPPPPDPAPPILYDPFTGQPIPGPPPLDSPKQGKEDPVDYGNGDGVDDGGGGGDCIPLAGPEDDSLRKRLEPEC
jgi:hypothetical protein